MCILRKFGAKIDNEASCFMRRHNATSYDITGKEARNWCKKFLCKMCYIGKIMKWFYKRANHALKTQFQIDDTRVILTIIFLVGFKKCFYNGNDHQMMI